MRHAATLDAMKPAMSFVLIQAKNHADRPAADSKHFSTGSFPHSDTNDLAQLMVYMEVDGRRAIGRGVKVEDVKHAQTRGKKEKKKGSKAKTSTKSSGAVGRSGELCNEARGGISNPGKERLLCFLL